VLKEAEEFEGLVGQAFEVAGFVPQKPAVHLEPGFDFVLTLNGVAQYAVEVKYYKTERPKSSYIKRSAERLLGSAKRQNISKAVLVVSCSVPGDFRAELEQDFQITVVDRADLLVMTSGRPELNDQLRAMVRGDIPPLDRNAGQVFDRIARSNSSTDRVDYPFPRFVGKELCRSLKDLPTGQKKWKAYEELCEKILKYLFENDLTGWVSQKWSEDGLNRNDLVCRARPLSEFWSFLIEDLESRYVVFEFKNYFSYVKQGQVLTTEKYLLKKALRSVAFLISRKGPDKNAFLMTQGAMREHGKLIVNLTDEDLCKMLEMKDSGDDPSDYLFDLADDFLLRLPR